MTYQNELTIFDDPMGIEYVRLASVKGCINLERVGMKSRGGSVKARLASEFGLPVRCPHADVIDAIKGKMDLLLALRAHPALTLTEFCSHKVYPVTYPNDTSRAARMVERDGQLFYMAQLADDRWYFIHLEEGGTPAQVGHSYHKRSELLADAGRYADIWGFK